MCVDLQSSRTRSAQKKKSKRYEKLLKDGNKTDYCSNVVYRKDLDLHSASVLIHFSLFLFASEMELENGRGVLRLEPLVQLLLSSISLSSLAGVQRTGWTLLRKI